jgi:hypothetical protein
MIRVVVCVLLGAVALPRPARAESGASASQPTVAAAPSVAALVAEQREREAFESYTTGRLYRWIGISLTVVGSLGMVAAASFGALGLRDVRDIPLLVITAIPSAACLAVGIPLWITGTARQQRALRLGYRPVLAAPFVAPTRGGVTAGLGVVSF